MRKITLTSRLMAIIAMALLATPGARAQDSDSKSGGSSSGKPEDTIEALLIVTFKRDLNLDTAEAVDLASRAKVLLEARRDFGKQQARIRRDLSDAVESGSAQNEKVDSLINEAFELRSAFAKAQQKSFFELSEGMPPSQRGKLFVSLERFEEKVRSHLRRFQEGGGRRGRGRDGDDDDL